MKKTIISYSTVIARVKEGKIHSLGKTSRTSGKHLGIMARLLNMPIVTNDKKLGFCREYEGTKNIDENAISEKISSQILYDMYRGSELHQIIVSLKYIPEKDWKKICFFLGLDPSWKSPTSKNQKIHWAKIGENKTISKNRV